MNKSLLLITIVSIFLSSCFAPVNLTYESAKTLKKGEIDVQGNYSTYSNIELESDIAPITFQNSNYGFKIGYGIKDRYTLKIRYEHLMLTSDHDFSLFSCCREPYITGIDYFEIENKFKVKNANVAFGVPLGYYVFSSGIATKQGLFAIDPRIYLTFFSNTEVFELNIIPKAHFLIGQGFTIMPGISMGLGFSSNLNKWALRPEVGYDGYFSYGISLNIVLANVMKKR